MSSVTLTPTPRKEEINEAVVFTIKKLGAELRVMQKGANAVSFVTRDHGQIFYSSKHPDGCINSSNTVRGGIPQCFPVIGPDNKYGLPKIHGFIRDQEHQLLTAGDPDLADWDLAFRYTQRQAVGHKFNYEFDFVTRFKVEGNQFTKETLVRNLGLSSMPFQLADHNYFAISGPQVSVTGLKTATFIDRMDANPHEIVDAADEFLLSRQQREVNRLYTFVPSGVITINDRLWERQVELRTNNFRNIIVWNPRERQLPDIWEGDQDKFICIEPAQVAERRLSPQEELRFSQTILAKPLVTTHR